ncbi:MAG: signal recognition particle protein [Acidimicrobiia bacterium]|nr:signal recognition particle protein [Acidimicrobiia bacterium]MXZ84700.1 signal recognition particle protein [Acidimicrobiia bacterium]MYE74724.1 signal recognition particle protein [Acidimicrobiia bacterium]MYG73727.1 signal recognition particle protein [Acidimicrobiia bacterium]MYJ60962.1 signal recognition particle protein [Acidimicrobiia bacterium]
MFDTLSNRFEGIFKRMRGLGILRESDVDEVLREIRLALLEADVNLHVVRGFQDRVRQRCVGAEVHKALNPVQQVIKFVHEELIATLGGETLEISHPAKAPTVVLLAGLQGSGKTTNAAKLASWFKQQGRNPMLVGADLQRPAAVEQLRTLGASIEVPVFSEPSDPVAVARQGVAEAVAANRDVVICDTAGRLAIDQEMMDQVGRISDAIEPHYTFLVVDAMTGQDAVTTAESFHEILELDGVILTKVDGDARGGAALSVKEVVGRPIAFSSTGEKIDEFELFHPDRVASRILGMGDVLTLVEKAEQVYEEAEAEATAAKLLEGEFTLEDFLEQMRQLKKMGSLQNLVGMLPGVSPELRNAEIEDDQIAQVEAIICSMTPQERATPRIVDGSRRQRIAAGSGTRPSEVSQLLRQFSEVQRMMKRMGGKGPGSGRKKPKKGRKGSRVTPPGGQQRKPGKPKLTLPGLEDGEFDLSSLR